MKLVVVESPTKSKTIQKFLGPEYQVVSSYGHVRDLPKSKLGVDLENDFKPEYVIPVKARKTVKLLKDEAKKANLIILSTDPDREGEAISWHIANTLDLLNNPEKYERITFHEITEEAIQEALKTPRKIDDNLVNSQQARRILDRIVGYKLSPFLWKKIAKGLSAGRVQSVTVRLIVEREREIEKFIPQEYWSIEAVLSKKDIEQKFVAFLFKKDGKTLSKLEIKDKETAEEIVKGLENADYKVISVERKESKKNPLPPFTTSTLQQEAWQRLRFSSKLTMQVAQGLYEKGLITYHRTDSLNLSEQSLLAAKEFIEKNFGSSYSQGSRRYKTKSRGAQEAHEAIRPSHPDQTPEAISEPRQQKLYDLIWRRFVASQMAPAVFNSQSAEIQANNYGFKANGQTLKFDGFLKVYPLKFEENELPPLAEEEILNLDKVVPGQHFTQPPARYNEASLIKALEEYGIGRPSTYAPTISTIQERNYIEKDEKRRFKPTEMGITVNDVLVEHFPQIVDIAFTAKMEEDLDEIAEGKEDWVKTLRDFYTDFDKNLSSKYQEVEKKNLIEKTDKKCPQCGGEMVIRTGRFGKFYACSKFPECKHTEPIEKPSLGIKCPKCNEGEVVAKRSKTKRVFYGCSRWPDCDFASWTKPKIDKEKQTG